MFKHVFYILDTLQIVEQKEVFERRFNYRKDTRKINVSSYRWIIVISYLIKSERSMCWVTERRQGGRPQSSCPPPPIRCLTSQTWFGLVLISSFIWASKCFKNLNFKSMGFHSIQLLSSKLVIRLGAASSSSNAGVHLFNDLQTGAQLQETRWSFRVFSHNKKKVVCLGFCLDLIKQELKNSFKKRIWNILLLQLLFGSL